MSHLNTRTLFAAASKCKNMSHDIIRQHRNLSNDITWGLFLFLAFIWNPLRGTMSLVLTCNWRPFFVFVFVPIEDKDSWFLPFSLNHLEPIPLWYQRLVKAWIFRATFQYSFDITSCVESHFPHRFCFFCSCYMCAWSSRFRVCHFCILTEISCVKCVC